MSTANQKTMQIAEEEFNQMKNEIVKLSKMLNETMSTLEQLNKKNKDQEKIIEQLTDQNERLQESLGESNAHTREVVAAKERDFVDRFREQETESRIVAATWDERMKAVKQDLELSALKGKHEATVSHAKVIADTHERHITTLTQETDKWRNTLADVNIQTVKALGHTMVAVTERILSRDSAPYQRSEKPTYAPKPVMPASGLRIAPPARIQNMGKN